MVGITRTVADIERSLDGSRRRIDDDLDELSRRMHSRAESIPGWAKLAGVAAALFLMRRPLFMVVKAVARVSAPVVVPLAIGRILERRSRKGEVLESPSTGELPAGEESVGDGQAFSDATWVS